MADRVRDPAILGHLHSSGDEKGFLDEYLAFTLRLDRLKWNWHLAKKFFQVFICYI